MSAPLDYVGPERRLRPEAYRTQVHLAARHLMTKYGARAVERVHDRLGQDLDYFWTDVVTLINRRLDILQGA